MDQFVEFLSKLKAVLASFSPAKKMSLVAVTIIALAGIGFIVYYSGQVEYRVLFSNLSSEDAGSIVSKLQEKKVPYSLSPGGDVVSVPAERVAELRLEMATAGLPQGGGVGFEIFDQKSFGSSEFEQQINYRRALQGELTRTINSLEEIQQSRVHLALPKDSLFIEQQKKSTASVTVKLKPGKSLRPLQVEGIAHLVASSVEGMNAEDVIIVDSKGNVLSSMPSDSKIAKMTSAQIDYQRAAEKEMASRIQSLLENVVGKGKAVVRVSAEMDFSIIEQTEEKYDPESPVVRSVKRMTDKTTAPANAAADSNNQEHDKADETINYEINKVVSKTVLPVGAVKKISVAVLIDGVYAKNDKGAEVYQPRVQKDIDALAGLVQKSVGINTARGDQIVVTEMPFSKVDLAGDLPAPSTWREKFSFFFPLIKYLLAFIAVFVLIMFFVRPLLKEVMTRDISRSLGELRGMSAVGAPVEDTVNISSFSEGGAQKELSNRELAKRLAEEDAKKFAEVLKTWLK
ncbi:MAG: flagellar M-ring protein FliF [Syntrophales bacterium]|jgi:flagellar M-ring protein FliF|nr:flagellar M-ring protein FliF [Syntrophales bacterium]